MLMSVNFVHLPFGQLYESKKLLHNISLNGGNKTKEEPHMTKGKKQLSQEQSEELLARLKDRFDKNMNRHNGLEWAKVQDKLEANPEKLWSLLEMEGTGGEPDVIGLDGETGEYIFYDCS